MRILSSAEKCRRVARRIFFTTSVAGSFSGTDFCLIFAPCEGYDEPEILPSSTHPICLMSADGGPNRSAALRRPLSRGSDPSGCPAEPLVSYRTNPQLSGWNLPPLMVPAFGAHRLKRTLSAHR